MTIVIRDSTRPKVVFCVHRFYPEVASTAQIMTELVFELCKEFEIEVIAIEPTDAVSLSDLEQLPENLKIHYLRVPKMNKKNKLSRLLHISTYFISASLRLTRIKNKALVFTISQPPIIGGLIGLTSRLFSRCPYIYNIQDFNPEQTEAVNYVKHKALLRVARLLDNWACRASNAIVLVGRDMVHTLAKRGIYTRLKKVAVINNWMNHNELFPLSVTDVEVQNFRSLYGLTGKFVIMYSGNLGLYYDLVTLLKVVIGTSWHDNMQFVFVGDGAVRDEMVRITTEAKIDFVTFVPYQDKRQLNVTLNAADVHLVVNQKGIKGVSVPSKLYGVMAVGKPVVGLQEHGSEGRFLIEESNCGLVGVPGDYDNFVGMIKQISSDQFEYQRQCMSENGRQYLLAHLTKAQSIERYKSLMSEVLSSSNDVREKRVPVT